MPKIIDKFDDDYSFLSNFYSAPHIVKDILFPTTEHSYQAFKDRDPAIWKKISLLRTPGEAKKAGGRSGIVSLREDWEKIKDKVMWNLLNRKFKIACLRFKLLQTGDAILIEGNWWGDTYWGQCKGEGKNKLGKMLMKLREEIRDE